MSLEILFKLVAYNSDLERFADQFGNCIETEDIQDLTAEFNKIVRLTDLKKINYCYTSAEAFDWLDCLASETLETELKRGYNISPVTLKVAKIFAFGLYSHRRGWFDDWDTLESDIINYLPNNEVKNWDSLAESTKYTTDRERFAEVMGVISNRFISLLWSDIKGQNIEFIDKIRLCEAFREEYEPNISQAEAYFKDWYYFEAFINCVTFGELFAEFSRWANELIFCTFDSNGDLIEGETTEADFIHLLELFGGLAVVFGGV